MEIRVVPKGIFYGILYNSGGIYQILLREQVEVFAISMIVNLQKSGTDGKIDTALSIGL